MQGALFEGPSPRPYHCPDCECRFEASPPPIANSTPVCPRCRGRNPVALSLAGVLGASSDAPSQILTDLLWLVSQIPRAVSGLPKSTVGMTVTGGGSLMAAQTVSAVCCVRIASLV